MNNYRKMRIRTWYIVLINAVVGCCIAATFPQFSMTVSDLSVKTGISESVLLFTDTIKSCGIVVAMLVAGFVYNKYGGRKVFIYMLAALVVPQILMPHINSVIIFSLIKFIQGTASIVFPVSLVIIMNWVEEKDTGVSTAVFNGIFYSGGGLGGTFAGMIIPHSSWTMSYYAMAVVQLLVGVIWLFTVKEKPSVRPGAVFVSEKQELMEGQGEKKNLLMTSKVWLLAVSFFATTWTVQAITVDMPIYAKALGYDELDVGNLLSAVTVGMILSCLVSGKISDIAAGKAKRKAVSRLLVLIFGYIIMIAAVMFILLADTKTFTIIYIAAFILTFGASWGLGAFYAVLPEFYDEKTVPIVTGITGGIGDVGMPVAPLVVGVIFGIRGMWDIGWATCCGIGLISVIAASILIVVQRRKSNL